MLSQRNVSRRGGFTLVELLMVVAIIAILAAIAVPNFLEAQMRSKLTRAQADMKTIVVGLASYTADYNVFPKNPESSPILGQTPLFKLTTPISYLAAVPHDVFWNANGHDGNDPAEPFYAFINLRQLASLELIEVEDTWEDVYYVVSRGPDADFDANDVIDGEILADGAVYDPSNGTISQGDLYLNAQGIEGGHILQNIEH